jgi:hypothetical protein
MVVSAVGFRGALVLASLATGCGGLEDSYLRDMAGLRPDCSAGQMGRLQGPIYAVSRSTRALPRKEAHPPIGYVCFDRLAIGERNGPPGFPGVTSRYEWFAVDLAGAFTVAKPGWYRFRLTSDDGAKVVVDGADVIDNDGYHPTRSAEVAVELAPGPHTISVPYWQGPGPLALMLEVSRPGQGYEIFQLDRPL